MSRTSKGLVIAVLAATAAGLIVSSGREPLRVVSFNWERHVDGQPAAIHSGKRVFWPGWDRKKIAAAVKVEQADARWWAPRNSSERYWVVLSDGSERELSLAEWSRLDKGSEW